MIQLNSCNSNPSRIWEFLFELDDFSNYKMSAKFRKKNDKKGEILKIVENQKC